MAAGAGAGWSPFCSYPGSWESDLEGDWAYRALRPPVTSFLQQGSTLQTVLPVGLKCQMCELMGTVPSHAPQSLS